MPRFNLVSNDPVGVGIDQARHLINPEFIATELFISFFHSFKAGTGSVISGMKGWKNMFIYENRHIANSYLKQGLTLQALH